MREKRESVYYQFLHQHICKYSSKWPWRLPRVQTVSGCPQTPWVPLRLRSQWGMEGIIGWVWGHSQGPRSPSHIWRRQSSTPMDTKGHSLTEGALSFLRCFHPWETPTWRPTLASSRLLSPRFQVHHHPDMWTYSILSPSPPCGSRVIFLDKMWILPAPCWLICENIRYNHKLGIFCNFPIVPLQDY